MLQMLYINDFPLNTQGVKLVLFVDHTNLPVVDKNELFFKKNVISYERIRDIVSKKLILNIEKNSSNVLSIQSI